MRKTYYLRFITSFFFTLFLCILSITPTHAHILQTNGSVGGVIHIDPNDEPKAQEQTQVFFDLKDTQGKFENKNCNCVVTITSNKKTVFTTPLFKKTNNPSFSYIFPKSGIYTITLKGISKNDSSFKPFTLNYDVRVEAGTPKKTTKKQENEVLEFFGTHIYHFLAGIIILGMCIVFGVLRIMGKIKD